VRLTPDDIRKLITSNQPEDIGLEYKSELPTGKIHKAEFLKDVTAMANADGGRIIYGIDEVASAASALRSVANTPREIDGAIKRLLAWCASEIKPPLKDLAVYSLTVDGENLVVIDVPRGHWRPHHYEFETDRSTSIEWVVPRFLICHMKLSKG